MNLPKVGVTCDRVFPCRAVEGAVVRSGGRAVDHREESSGQGRQNLGGHEDRHEVLMKKIFNFVETL